MFEVIVPLLTMAVGFLCGVLATDGVIDSKRTDSLERRIRNLERRVQNDEL